MTDSRQAKDQGFVVITGCSGLIGRHLMTALADRYSVVGVDIQLPPVLPRGCSFIRCDLTRDDSVTEALQRLRAEHGNRIASVVHLAAHYDFSGAPSDMYQTLTRDGTRRLLDGLVNNPEFDVKQFLFVSTLLVMKPSEDGKPIDESCETAATWAYPESKIQAELLIEERCIAVPSVVVRLAGVYDEYGRTPAITEHVKRIYDKSLTSFFFPGDAQRGQAFVHIDDTVSALVAAVVQRNELHGHQIFLIAEPDAMPYARLQEVIGERIHGKQWPTIEVPKPLAKAGAWVQDKLSPEGDKPFIQPWMVDMADAHYPVNVARARKLLGWAPLHRLEASLPRILETMLENPTKWFEVNGMEPPEKAPSERRSAVRSRSRSGEAQP